MRIETTTVTLTVDEYLEKKVQALMSEGWEVSPAKLPEITYELQRVVVDEAPLEGQMGVLRIDDTQVTVIRASDQK